MKILLLGKNGQVGWELQRALSCLGELTCWGRQEADLAKIDTWLDQIKILKPDVIVNAAAYTAVDKAQSEPELAWQINAHAPKRLAELAQQLQAWLIHYSTDYVFDGSKPDCYYEDDLTNPLSVYGQTKLAGEQAIMQTHDQYIILRTSWVHGRHGHNFAKTMLRLATQQDSLKIVADQIGSPTSAELIADVTAVIIAQMTPEHAGIYHLVAAGQASWYDYAKFVINTAHTKGIALKTTSAAIYPIATTDYPLPAPRPKNSQLATDKLTKRFKVYLPDWRLAVARLVEELI